MAYYNPYYSMIEGQLGANKPKTGSDFLSDMNVNPYNKRFNIPTPVPPQEQSTGSQFGGAQIAGSALAGLDAYNQNNVDAQGFQPPNAFKTVGSIGAGFMAGGPIGAGVAALGAAAGQVSGLNKAIRNVNTNVDAVEYDMYGRPQYQGADVARASSDANKLLGMRNKISGVQAIFGGRRKLKRKARELQRNIRAAQNTYNTQTLAANQQQLAMDEYNQTLNNQTRMLNLYNIGNNLY